MIFRGCPRVDTVGTGTSGGGRLLVRYWDSDLRFWPQGDTGI